MNTKRIWKLPSLDELNNIDTSKKLEKKSTWVFSEPDGQHFYGLRVEKWKNQIPKLKIQKFLLLRGIDIRGWKFDGAITIPYKRVKFLLNPETGGLKKVVLDYVEKFGMGALKDVK